MSWFTRLNPTPTFPAYTGPYKVGSVDVEIPSSELENPGPSPSPCTNLPTVAFRIFYPCRQGSEQRGVRWIASPQREVVGAYARFLGANSVFASMFSLIPQLLYYITIPVHNNADIQEPTTKNGRWPVVIFSHGLGGSRNAYSHICGSLASHGLVVVAPDHRDGSAPISFMHSPDEKEKGKLRRVEYTRIAHQPSPEVYEARDEQLRVRLWELGLIHDALLKIDQRVQLTNLAEDQKRTSGKDMLTMFSHTLNVHEPGAITFAGHSFGGATTVQFLKSVYYRPDTTDTPDYRPLFTPSKDSSIVKQITPETPTILLDLWCLPLQSPATAYLKGKPLPCYDSSTGGSNLLAILSEAFFKWTPHLHETKRIIAKPTGASDSQPGPHLFFPIASAHLSQSDFGILFPWVITKIFGAKEPERVLGLNTRAILQVLRNSGVEVAKTSFADLELEGVGGDTNCDSGERGLSQDTKILSRTRGSVRGWVCLGVDVEDEDVNEEEEEERVSGGPVDAVVEGEVLGEVVDAKEREHL